MGHGTLPGEQHSIKCRYHLGPLKGAAGTWARVGVEMEPSVNDRARVEGHAEKVPRAAMRRAPGVGSGDAGGREEAPRSLAALTPPHMPSPQGLRLMHGGEERGTAARDPSEQIIKI